MPPARRIASGTSPAASRTTASSRGRLGRKRHRVAMRALNPQPPGNQRSRPVLGLEAQGEPLALTDEVFWPHPTWVARARWAAQTVERFLHVARIIRSRAAAWPAAQGALSTGSPRP